jgi:hypothetical protein
MILATTTVEDFDRFTKIFSTTSADKRALYGSKGATVFHDPNAGWQQFASDPEVPPIMPLAGHTSRPQVPSLSAVDARLEGRSIVVKESALGHAG